MIFVILLIFCAQSTLVGSQRVCESFMKDETQCWDCESLNLTNVLQMKAPTNSMDCLVLTSNPLYKLEANAFKNWSNLQQLNLRNTSLVSVHRDAISSLSMLTILDLSENNLRLPDYLPLEALPTGLRELHLSRNPLGVLPDNHFSRLSELQLLKLHSCQIHTVYPDAFAGLRSLRILHLYINELRTLPEENTLSSWRSMPNLTEVLLGGNSNQWNCDCRLQWLKLWFIENRDSVKVTITERTPNGNREWGPVCASPPSMSGVQLFDKSVSSKVFRCRQQVTTKPVEVSGTVTVFKGFPILSAETVAFIAIAGAWVLALCCVVGAICFRIGQSCGARTEYLTTEEPNLGSNLPQLKACVTAMEEEAERKESLQGKEEASKENVEDQGEPPSISYV